MEAGETITDTGKAHAEIGVFGLAVRERDAEDFGMIRELAFSVALFLSVYAVMAQDAAPTPEPPPVISATDADGIRALAGKAATVEGKIVRVGSTEAGGIKFINFAGSSPNGFVAVVFKSDYGAFVGGFDQYKGAKVRLTGVITIYKETTPQIVVKSPNQIKIVEAAPTPTPSAPEGAAG